MDDLADDSVAASNVAELKAALDTLRTGNIRRVMTDPLELAHLRTIPQEVAVCRVETLAWQRLAAQQTPSTKG